MRRDYCMDLLPYLEGQGDLVSRLIMGINGGVLYGL